MSSYAEKNIFETIINVSRFIGRVNYNTMFLRYSTSPASGVCCVPRQFRSTYSVGSVQSRARSAAFRVKNEIVSAQQSPDDGDVEYRRNVVLINFNTQVSSLKIVVYTVKSRNKFNK